MPSGINSKSYARERLTGLDVHWVKECVSSYYSDVHISLGKNATWHYSNMQSATPADATHVVVFGYSDYGGNSCDRSNVEALVRDYPRFTCTAIGDMGSAGLVISANTGMSETTRELVDAIANAITDYPLYDEEHHSEMEMRAADDAWDSYLSQDVPRDIKTRATPGGYKAFGTDHADKRIPRSPFYGAPEFVEDYVEALEARERARDATAGPDSVTAPPAMSLLQEWFCDSLRDCDGYPYFESAVDIVFPEYEEQIYAIAERMLADILAPYDTPENRALLSHRAHVTRQDNCRLCEGILF